MKNWKDKKNLSQKIPKFQYLFFRTKQVKLKNHVKSEEQSSNKNFSRFPLVVLCSSRFKRYSFHQKLNELFSFPFLEIFKTKQSPLLSYERQTLQETLNELATAS